MLSTFSQITRNYNIIQGFILKNLFNLNSYKLSCKNVKLLTTGKVCFLNKEGTQEKRELPSLFYIQTPTVWLRNKFDFFMLKNTWDPEFDEDEFKRGARQASAVICTLISQSLWSSLKGLITNKTLERLKREVEVNWSEDQRKSIGIEPSDIKLVLPRKVHFLKVADQRFVDIDVISVAMKYKDENIINSPVIVIEVFAQFHRNYTIGNFSGWIVRMFKVSVQNVK